MTCPPSKSQNKQHINLAGGFNPSEQCSQLGWLFPILWKIKNVPNISKPPTSNPLRSLSKQPITKDHPLEPSAPAVPSCSKIPLPESQAPGVCWVQPASVLRLGLLSHPKSDICEWSPVIIFVSEVQYPYQLFHVHWLMSKTTCIHFIRTC